MRLALPARNLKTPGRLDAAFLWRAVLFHGAVFDVAVDLRESSSTFGKWVGVELSAENKKQIWIPKGFAHGFLVLSDEAEFLYKTTNYWHATSEQAIIWNDPTLNIRWPKMDVNLVINSKDAVGHSWHEAPKFN